MILSRKTAHKVHGGFFFDVLVTLSGQVFVMLIALLLNKAMSTRLGPEGFTGYSLITKTGAIFAYIILVSMGIALPRYIPLYRAQGDREREAGVFFASIAILAVASFIMALITYLFRIPLCTLIWGNYCSLNLLACYFFALKSAYTAYLYALMRADGKFLLYSLAQIAIDGTCLALSLLFFDAIKIIFVMSFMGLLLSIAMILFEYRKIYRGRFVLEDGKREIGVLLKYGIPRIPGEILLFSFTSVPLMLLNQKIGAFETAGFTISLGIISAATPLFSYVGLVLLPHASEALAKKEYVKLNRRIAGLILLFLILSICMAAAIFLFGSIVIRILYSGEYLRFIETVHMIIPSIIPMSMYLLLRNPLDALSELPINTGNLAVSFFVLIVAINWSSSIEASAFAFLAGYTILGVLSVISFLFIINKRKAENNE